jgi:hypothetical protein
MRTVMMVFKLLGRLIACLGGIVAGIVGCILTPYLFIITPLIGHRPEIQWLREVCQGTYSPREVWQALPGYHAAIWDGSGLAWIIIAVFLVGAVGAGLCLVPLASLLQGNSHSSQKDAA